MDIGHKLQINDSVCPYLFSMWIDDPLILKLTASNVLRSLTSQKLKLKDKKEQLVYKWIISCTPDTFYDAVTWHVKSCVSLLLHVNASFHSSTFEQNCGFYVLGSRSFSKSFISDKNTSDILLKTFRMADCICFLTTGFILLEKKKNKGRDLDKDNVCGKIALKLLWQLCVYSQISTDINSLY